MSAKRRVPHPKVKWTVFRGAVVAFFGDERLADVDITTPGKCVWTLYDQRVRVCSGHEPSADKAQKRAVAAAFERGWSQYD